MNPLLLSGYFMASKKVPFKPLIQFLILFIMFFSSGMIPTYLNIRSLGLYNTLWALILPGAMSVYNAIICKPTIAVLLLYYGVSHWNSWFNASIYLRDNEKLPIQNVMRSILIANSNILNVAAAENDQVNQFAESIKYSTIVLTTLPVLRIYPFFAEKL